MRPNHARNLAGIDRDTQPATAPLRGDQDPAARRSHRAGGFTYTDPDKASTGRPPTNDLHYGDATDEAAKPATIATGIHHDTRRSSRPHLPLPPPLRQTGDELLVRSSRDDVRTNDRKHEPSQSANGQHPRSVNRDPPTGDPARSVGEKTVHEEDVTSKDEVPEVCEDFLDVVVYSTKDLERMDFVTKRRLLADAMSKLPLDKCQGKTWQTTIRGVEIGDTIWYPSFEFLRNMKLVNDEKDMTWYSVAGGFILAKVRFGIVDDISSNRVVVRPTTTFGGTSKARKRDEEVTDKVSGGKRWALNDFVHVILVGHNVEEEARCFESGLSVKWRLVEGSREPTKKESFMPIDSFYEILETHPICVVGRLASPGDLLKLGTVAEICNKRKQDRYAEGARVLGATWEREDAERERRKKEDVERRKKEQQPPRILAGARPNSIMAAPSEPGGVNKIGRAHV